MKRILACVLAIIMVFSIAACGNAPAAPSQSPASAQPSESTDAPESTEAPANNETPANSTDEVDLDGNATIKLGLVSWMTGPNKDYGEYISAAAQLAVKEANEAGGVLGKQIELVEEDQGEDQQSSINATMKLLNYGDVSVIVGSTISTYTIAMLDTIKEYGIPYFSCGSSINISNQNNPYIWQPRMTDDLSGSMLAKAAVEQYKIQKPAVLYMNDSFGQGFADAAIAYLKNEYGIEPAAVLSFDGMAEKNFSSYFTQIMNSGCDSLIAVGNVINAPLIMKQAESVEFKFPKLCVAAMASPDVFELAGAAAEGWVSVTDWSKEAPTEVNQAFIKNYAALAGRDPTVLSAYVYDATKLAIEAIRLAGSANHEAIKEAVAGIEKYPGVMATMTSRESRSLADSMWFVEVKDGKAVVLDTIYRPQ